MKSTLKRYDDTYNKELKIELYYSLGGINYFTGTHERRGFYLSVTPVERSKDESGRFVSEGFTAFSGVKKLIRETKRYSEKVGNSLVNDYLETDIKQLIEHVVSKNNLTLKSIQQ